MKRKNIVLIIVSVILVIVAAYGGFMYIPQRIVAISPSDISSIKIGNGDAEKEITITERSDIEHIIGNLNDIRFYRKKSATNHGGYSYDITIYKNDENVYKDLVINSSDTIRYGASFYKDNTNSIDYDYIDNLFLSASENESSDADVKLSVDYEEKVDLSQFSSVYRLTEDRTDNGGYGIVLWCDQTVNDFTVTLMYNDAVSTVFTDKEVLFTLPQVEKGQAVVLVTYIPETIPKTKVSFNSASGIETKCLISWSGENGDVLLLNEQSSGLDF